MTLNVEALRELYRHMEWADAMVWTAILASEDETDASLRTLLYHVHYAQRAFLQVWKDEQPPPFKEDAHPTLPDVLTWARTFYPEAHAFLSGVTTEQLDQQKPVPWARMFETQVGTPPKVTTLGEIIFQAWAHTHYHRGQVNTKLRQLGGEPPLVDYIAWIWADRPMPAWPA